MRVSSKCTLNFANLRLKTLPVLRGEPNHWLRPIAMRYCAGALHGRAKIPAALNLKPITAQSEYVVSESWPYELANGLASKAV